MTANLANFADMFHVLSDTCHMASFTTYGGAFEDALSYRNCGMPSAIQYRGRTVPVTRSDWNEHAEILDSLRGYTDSDVERVKAHLDCLTYHARRTLEAAQQGEAAALRAVIDAGVPNYG